MSHDELIRNGVNVNDYWAGYDCFVGYFPCPDDETEDFKTGFNDARLISLGLKEDSE